MKKTDERDPQCCICRKDIIISSSFTKHCEVLKQVVKEKYILVETACAEYKAKMETWRDECERIIVDRNEAIEENEHLQEYIDRKLQTIKRLKKDNTILRGKIKIMKNNHGRTPVSPSIDNDAPSEVDSVI